RNYSMVDPPPGCHAAVSPESASPSSTVSLTASLACLGGPATTITVSRSASPSSSHDDASPLHLTTVDEQSIDNQASLHPPIDKIAHTPIIGVPNGPRIIEVKCGPLHAKMHVEHFLCPGIHQPCIELDGEMISPKEFTVRANKDKQKDWKGSIRIGKSNLRSLMEMRSFDFYNHGLFCSAKCQSRNYITPKSALLHSSEKNSASSSSSISSESDKDSSRRSSKSSIEQLLAMQLAAAPPPPSAAAAAAAAKTQFGYGYQPDHCDSISQFVHLQQALNNNNNNNDNNTVKEEIIDVTSPPEVVLPTADQITGMMRAQPSLFWSQLAHTNLLEDVIDLVQQEVDMMRATAKHAGPASPPGKAADSLCRVALSLQLGEQIAARVRTRHFQQTAMHEMERKRRLEAYPSTLGDAIKRPCLQYQPEPAPLLKLIKQEPKQNEFVPSSNSAFSMPTPSHHVELLLKLAVLQQMQQQQQSVMAPPPPMPPPAVPEMSFNVQLTEALLKIQANQAATPVQ
ncbi:hypothetical protein PMAYCL1PPCAC_01285, partial [Pristionchus mayeri]